MNSKLINLIFIIAGGIIAFYAQAGETQNTYILIGGIVLLMIGLYRISKGIPEKPKAPVESINIEEEE